MRTIIDIPEHQIEALAAICELSQASRAQVIRQAIEEYLAHHAPATTEPAFGIYNNVNVDGLDYQKRLRKEWSE